MLLHAYSVNECRSQARFCLLWGLVSSLGMVFSILGGFPAAIVVGVFAYFLSTGTDHRFSPLSLALSVAAVGVLTGLIVGIAQSAVLTWPMEARRRWIVRSVFGWGFGAGIGAFVAFCYELQGGSGPVLPRSPDSLVMVIMTPILGLVLGLVLRPALPSPTPNLLYWLAVNIFAASFGWIAAWWITGSSSFFGLTWAGLVLGPAVYAMVTGTLMLGIERRRLKTDRGDTPLSRLSDMMNQPHPWPAWMPEFRFWLLWVVVSSLLATLGFGSGVVISVVVSFPLAALLPGWAWPLPGAAIVGALVGALLGKGQSLVLRGWTPGAAERWKRRSLAGWTLGAVSGLLGATIVLSGLAQLGLLSAGFDLIASGFVLSTALGGIVIGLVLWPALPSPAPNRTLWLTLNVAAISFSWLATLLVLTSSVTAKQSWAAFVLGPLVYAIISGSMMAWLERRRIAADSES